MSESRPKFGQISEFQPRQVKPLRLAETKRSRRLQQRE
jgi:hypothetical protein